MNEKYIWYGRNERMKKGMYRKSIFFLMIGVLILVFGVAAVSSERNSYSVNYEDISNTYADKTDYGYYKYYSYEKYYYPYSYSYYYQYYNYYKYNNYDYVLQNFLYRIFERYPALETLFYRFF